MVFIHEVYNNPPQVEFLSQTLNKETLLAISEVLFFRHGETKLNAQKILQGSSDDDATRLTAEGIRMTSMQAAEIAKLQNPPRGILLSPLQRTLHTARIIGEHLPGVVLRQKESLREFGFGDWEAVAINRLVNGDLSEAHNANFMSNPFAACKKGYPPNGENFFEFAKRIQKTMKVIEYYANEERTIVVTHAMVLRMVRYIVFLTKCFPNQEISDKMLQSWGEYFFWDDGQPRGNDKKASEHRLSPPHGLIGNEFLLLNDLKTR